MTTVADYIGRTVDVLAFTGQQLRGDTLLTQSLASAAHGNGGGEVCTGIQKLAQRWLIEFLTTRGSITHLPKRGSDFMGQVRRSELRTNLDAEQAYHLAAAQVKDNLAAEDDAATPDDESLLQAELLAIAVTGDTLVLRVKIVSRAGTARQMIFPIATAQIS